MPALRKASAWDDGAREAVEEEAGGAVGLLDALGDQADDDVVAHQQAFVHHLLGSQTEWRAGLDGGPQHVAGGDLRNREAVLDELRLRALARARRSEQDDSHDMRLPGCGRWSGIIECRSRWRDAARPQAKPAPARSA